MSNRESGFDRYDVMLEPRDKDDEKELAATVKAALEQIDRKEYAAALIAKGMTKDKIRKYGFAFCGNEVLIGNRQPLPVFCSCN